MATNFPASLDSLTNPTASDKLNSVTVPHASQHSTLNDAVEALEAKVGVDGSAVTTSHDYLIAKQSVVPYADASARTTAVPSPVEGQMSYLEDTNSVEVYDGSAWTAVKGGGGLVFISRTTIGSAVSSVTVSGAFSSDYDNYRIVIAGSVGSINLTCAMRLGATASGYKYAIRQNSFAGSGTDVGTTGASEFALGGIADSAGSEGHIAVDVCGPNLAHGTSVTSMNIYGHPTVGRLDIFGGVEPSSTQHTAFDILATTGTMTGGTIDVYGYAKA